MRFHVVFLLVVVLGVASSNGFFLKKAAETFADVKSNLVKDAKTAISDLKESARLKGKAVTGGIKAIGHAKLGLVKGIKHAKIGVLKGIAGAKLAKLAAIKAGKLVFVKTLVAAKLAPHIKSGAIKEAVSSLPLGPGLFQGFKDQLSSAPASISHLFANLGSSSSPSTTTESSPIDNSNVAPYPAPGFFEGLTDKLAALTSNPNFSIGNLLPNFGGRDGGNLALFPAPSGFPTHINIVTYKSEAPKNGDSAPPAPVTSYGTPIRPSPPSTSYGVPFRR